MCYIALTRGHIGLMSGGALALLASLPGLADQRSSPGGEDTVVVPVGYHGKVHVQRAAQQAPCGRQALLKIAFFRHDRHLPVLYEDADEQS